DCKITWTQQQDEHSSPSMLQELECSSTRLLPTRVGREIGSRLMQKECMKSTMSICCVTRRPTDSTGEFEDCLDEVEELCRSELKKCLRVPEEQAPLKGLDLTCTGHPMKILETSERVTRNRKNK